MSQNFKYTLSFRLDFYDEFNGYSEYIAPKTRADFYSFDDAQYETLRVIYHSMGLKLHSVAWTEVELTPKNIEMLLEKFAELKERKIAYPSAGHIHEELSKALVPECEWFSIDAPYLNQYDGELVLDKGYPFSKAYKYPPYLHIQGHFVSEDFKTLVEKEKLTGVDFLWAEDRGKYAAKQWYAMRATHAMGRGFDSPWFDGKIYKKFQTELDPKVFIEQAAKGGYPINGEKYLQSKIAEYEKNFSDIYRTGITYFPAVAVGDRLSNQPLMDRLMHHFSLTGGMVDGLVISTVPRFLKKHLPQTDFAYFWDTVGNIRLCFNKKTKELLLGHSLIKERDIRPLAIYDNLPEDCMDLADDAEYPPSIYTDKEFKALKKEEKERRAKFDKKELPRRMPNMKNTLKLLRHTKKEQDDKSVKGISKKKITEFEESMTISLPEYWLDVLKISNGGEYGVEDRLDCIIVPLYELEAFHADEVDHRKKVDEDYVAQYTYFASTVTGDSYAFDKKPSKGAKDAKVILISHEDFSIEREWGNIADFLETILLGL